MKQKSLVDFLLRYGLAKTKQIANGMLLAVALINFLMSVYLLQGIPSQAFSSEDKQTFNEETIFQ